jgi:tetratricopeptide (TPR) repeat protein
VSGVAVPREPHYGGTVYLFVDRETSSASEPLAHALKVAKRVTIVGQRTAGAMLTALPQALRDGWVVTVPQADFVAADGTRLEGRGVQPDIATDPGDVFLTVADRIEPTLPFSGAMLRGGSYEGLKKPADAERAYRAALRVADRQTPAPPVSARAALHKRLAVILEARGDQAGALREYREVLKLVPDDAEALAAVRGG